MEEQDEVFSRILSNDHVHRRVSRSGCADRTEQDIYNVVQYIPIIGQLWGIGSAIGYAATHCKDAAKERAIDVAIGVALDVATVATLGTGAAAFQGLKVAVKAGVKYGAKAALKAGFKASGTAFKKFAVQSLKQSKQWLKNPIKSLIKDTKNTYHALKNIPRAVRNVPKALKSTAKGVKNYIDEVAEIRKTRKALKKQIKGAEIHKNKWKYEVHTPTVKQEVTYSRKYKSITDKATVEYHTTNPYVLDTKTLKNFKLQGKVTAKGRKIYTKAELHADTVWRNLKKENVLYESPSSHGISIASCRLKRSPGKKRKLCSLPDPIEDKLKNILVRRAERGEKFKEVNRKFLVPKLGQGDVSLTIKKGRGFQQMTFSGAEGAQKLDLVNTNIGVTSTNDIANKYIFGSLQHYNDFSPAFTIAKKDGVKMVTRAPVEVDMVIGGKPRKFVLTDSKMHLGEKVEGQIFISTSDANFVGTQTSSDYDTLWRELAGSDGLEKQRAQEILAAIEDTPATQLTNKWEDIRVGGKQLFTEQQERAAVELIAITQIAENALPDERLVNAMVQSKIPRSWGARSGRVPGSDKWARSVLKEIEDGKITWEQAFNREGGIYTLARKGGTEHSRKLFAGRKQLQDSLSDIRSRTLEEISDSSDSDYDRFFSRLD